MILLDPSPEPLQRSVSAEQKATFQRTGTPAPSQEASSHWLDLTEKQLLQWLPVLSGRRSMFQCPFSDQREWCSLLWVQPVNLLSSPGFSERSDKKIQRFGRVPGEEILVPASLIRRKPERFSGNPDANIDRPFRPYNLRIVGLHKLFRATGHDPALRRFGHIVRSIGKRLPGPLSCILQYRTIELWF